MHHCTPVWVKRAKLRLPRPPQKKDPKAKIGRFPKVGEQPLRGLYPTHTPTPSSANEGQQGGMYQPRLWAFQPPSNIPQPTRPSSKPLAAAPYHKAGNETKALPKRHKRGKETKNQPQGMWYRGAMAPREGVASPWCLPETPGCSVLLDRRQHLRCHQAKST